MVATAVPDVVIEDIESFPDDVPPDSADLPSEPRITLDDEPESPADKVRRIVGARKSTPRARPSTAKRTVPLPTAMPTSAELREAVTGVYVTFGVLVSLVDPICGMAIGENAPAIAESWDTLAQGNPAVAKALKSLTGVSGWGGVLAAHVPFVLMIGAHHGKVKGPVAEQLEAAAMKMNPQTAARFGQPVEATE